MCNKLVYNMEWNSCKENANEKTEEKVKKQLKFSTGDTKRRFGVTKKKKKKKEEN